MIYVVKGEVSPETVMEMVTELENNDWGQSERDGYRCVHWDESDLQESVLSKEQLPELFIDDTIDAASIVIRYDDTEYEVRMGYTRRKDESMPEGYDFIEIKSLSRPLRGNNETGSAPLRDRYINVLQIAAEHLQPVYGYGSNGPAAPDLIVSAEDIQDGFVDEALDFYFIPENTVGSFTHDELSAIPLWSIAAVDERSALAFIDPPGNSGTNTSREHAIKGLRRLID